MNQQNALQTLSAMSEVTRLNIIKALVKVGDNGLTAGEISTLVGATPSRASFHLSTLSDADLVRSKRQSKQIIYIVNFLAIGALIDYIMTDCCQGNAKLLSCCGSVKPKQ